MWPAPLSDTDRRRLAHPLVGGIILFARNWQDRAQLLQLTAAIKAVRHDLLICVDHEGGRVQRFRTDGFTHVPPMRALGELWMNDGKAGAGSGALRAMDAATAAGYVLGVSCAPAASISASPRCWTWTGAGGVIGDRAFARDPRVVACWRAPDAGLLQAGMYCGKHFPGHGFVRPIRTPTFRSTGAASRPSWPKMPRPIRGCPRCSPASCRHMSSTPGRCSPGAGFSGQVAAGTYCAAGCALTAPSSATT